MATTEQTRTGVFYGIGAYGFWGVIPIFWKALDHIDPFESSAHRVIWACASFVGFTLALGRASALFAVMRNRRLLRSLAVSAALLCTNWVVFVFAVSSDRVAEASLGYFINPLVSVALGRIVLGEALTRWSQFAIAVAGAGVVVIATTTGAVPWISLCLAGSFGLYGLLRKTTDVDALIGSSVETLLLLPLATTAAIWLHDSQWRSEPMSIALLLLTGPVTALPLLWFTRAARRLRLTTLGLLQYLTPSTQLLVAVFLFEEPMPQGRLVGFALIWVALALYSAHRLRDSAQALAR